MLGSIVVVLKKIEIAFPFKARMHAEINKSRVSEIFTIIQPHHVRQGSLARSRIFLHLTRTQGLLTRTKPAGNSAIPKRVHNSSNPN